MAKSGPEGVLKKDPAAEKAPDAGAVDSDKAKAMFAAHAPRHALHTPFTEWCTGSNQPSSCGSRYRCRCWS